MLLFKRKRKTLFQMYNKSLISNNWKECVCSDISNNLVSLSYTQTLTRCQALMASGTHIPFILYHRLHSKHHSQLLALYLIPFRFIVPSHNCRSIFTFLTLPFNILLLCSRKTYGRSGKILPCWVNRSFMIFFFWGWPLGNTYSVQTINIYYS